MQRINIVGASGSGKTTVANQIASRLGLPLLELDAVHHLPDWQERPSEDFRSEVGAFIDQDRWVVDGNYSKARDLIWGRADTVVFLDLPRWRVMTQLIPRTLRRVVTRQELWHGNRERWSNLTTLDPARSILAWSWTTHRKHHDRFQAALVDPKWGHIDFVRLGSRGDISRFLRVLA